MNFTLPYNTRYKPPQHRWLLLLPLLPILYMLSVRFLLIFSYNTDLDGAEFTFIHYLQQLLSGKPLYLDPEHFPFSATIYTPAYLYLVYFVCKFYRLDYIRDIHEIYMAGRTVSFFFVFVSLFYIDRFSKRQNAGAFTRMLMLCIFLLLITGHAYATRPDSMKIACFIMAVFYYTEYFYFSGSRTALILFLLAFVLSVSAKQDVLLYLLLLQSIQVLLSRQLKALSVLFISLLLAALLFLIIYSISGIAAMTSLFPFNLQMISDYRNSYNFYVVIFSTLRLSPLYLILILLLRNRKDGYSRLIAICGILAGISTTLFLFRPGSFLNYAYELIVFLSVGTGLYLSNLAPKRFFVYGFSAYLSLLFISNILIRNYAYNSQKEDNYRKDMMHDYAMRKIMEPKLQQGAVVFSPDLELSIFLADKQVIYGHEYHLDRLIYAHLGLHTRSRLMLNSSEGYDRCFRDGSVPYVVAYDKAETRKLMDSCYPAYHLSGMADRFLLYEFGK